MRRTESIIYSMTKAERSNPDILNPSRKNRIAIGQGILEYLANEKIL